MITGSRAWCFTALMAAVLVLRAIAAAWVPLIPEEAYYWMYSRHMEWAYFDHPPIVSWVIGAGTAVFGNTELGVRSGPMLLACGAAVLMCFFGRLWFGRRTGWLAAVLLLLLPVYFGMGFIATMDSALLFFWLAALLGLSAALKRNETAGWYVFGTMTGLAFLSKYTAVFLPVGMLMTLAGRPRWRRWLRTPHPWLALLLALGMSLPVVLWNARHEWASFRFQFIERYADDTYNLRTVANFWLMQLALLTPIPLMGLLVLLWREASGRRWRRPGHWFALSFFLPAAAVVVAKSLTSTIHINWTAPIYLSILPWLVHTGRAYLRLEQRKRTRWRWRPGAVATGFLCLLVNSTLLIYLLALQPRMHWWRAFGPWKPLAQVVEEHEERLETETSRPPLVIADGQYRLASVLAFYRNRFDRRYPFNRKGAEDESSRFTTSQWVLKGKGLGYEYWLSREAMVGRAAVYVSDRKNFGALIAPWFERVETARDPRLAGTPYHLLVCHCLPARSMTAPAK